ncbi:hypothetical protein BOR07_21890 [Salmonella enterica]|uniref:Uncharacterized protein n=3 Tax=Salmonella enterica TaxID=28901 RepID=A0A607PIK7_SALET|nr:hypothetical protein [Salmonella enterica subsp. enterica serovar Javiana]EAA9793099.1 hypothetical protein [Salmonella enterica]EDB2981768.1 hypothetical protein [Salmonella enterica subsp. enterica serovar Give]EDD4495376.1 hypothetical protein [Salmonella enterica subsp. enterica serovar Newport]EDD5583558.1 hypothetical protein [Salmonella enterica subsp. enterica serovar Enteritidis]EDK0621060.1 hypothetical protein [Salmonella bongori]
MSPIASFDVNAREALSNPHQAAIDVKKPAGLVPCGLSVLHRTYPDHHLGWRLCALNFILLIFNILI